MNEQVYYKVSKLQQKNDETIVNVLIISRWLYQISKSTKVHLRSLSVIVLKMCHFDIIKLLTDIYENEIQWKTSMGMQ